MGRSCLWLNFGLSNLEKERKTGGGESCMCYLGQGDNSHVIET